MCKKYVFFLICCLLFTAKSTSASDVNITSNSETDIIGDTDMSADKENLPELINYTFYIDAPETFPVELFYADFLLDKPNNITYSYRKIFVDHHNDNSNTIRVENEKPFPHSVDMVWYSITENKAYSLIQELPYDMLKEQIKNYDAILLSLTPYGQVNLYSYNVFTEKKDWIGLYHAKEINLELADFRKSGALYENPEMPVKNWQEYQLNALAYFSKAAVFMHENDYIMPPKDFDFWQKNYIKEPAMPSLDAINKLDENGETPLINAVRTQNTALVVRLIVAGADLNIQSKNSGETALSAACSMNHLQYAKYLIMKGADLNLPEAQSGKTPLMLASLAGHDKIVELLIKSGADVNARQFMYGQDIGYNALKYAKENNNQQIVEMLLQAGAEEIS